MSIRTMIWTIWRARQGKFGLIVSDAVFSLPRFVAIARKYGFFSMIDEAHVTGVLGPRGSGLAKHCGLAHGADICVGTVRKALASEGGFVTGSQLLCDYLRKYSLLLLQQPLLLDLLRLRS